MSEEDVKRARENMTSARFQRTWDYSSNDSPIFNILKKPYSVFLISCTNLPHDVQCARGFFFLSSLTLAILCLSDKSQSHYNESFTVILICNSLMISSVWCVFMYWLDIYLYNSFQKNDYISCPFFNGSIIFSVSYCVSVSYMSWLLTYS